MRNTFCGFYSLSDEDVIRRIWNSDKTIFIFDTNCLLNLYRCEDKTRDDILSVMARVSHNIWLPFFVCLEYQKNRRNVITESIDSLNKISNSLNKVVNSVTDSLSEGKVKKHLYNSLSEGVHSLQSEIKPLIDKFIQEHIEPRINSKTKINIKDTIRDEIDNLVSEKCGSPPTKEWVSNVNSNGDYRYKNLIPPGFLDSTKKGKKHYRGLEFEDKYGDLYIWMEILDKCHSENIENVILICDDNKDDWWYETKGITHGPLESLQTEIYANSNVKNFKLLNQATFLRDAQKYLSDITIDLESLKEVQDIAEDQTKSSSQQAYDSIKHITQPEDLLFGNIMIESLLSEPEANYEIKSNSDVDSRSKVSVTQLKMLAIKISSCLIKLNTARNMCLSPDFKTENYPNELLIVLNSLGEQLSLYKRSIYRFLEEASEYSSNYSLVPRGLVRDIKRMTSKCTELIDNINSSLNDY